MTTANPPLSLKELRRNAGKTQREVASDLGIALNTYRRWEKNAASLRVSQALALTQYFSVSLGAILLCENT